MKLFAVFALTALMSWFGSLSAQDTDQQRTTDHLRDCENLSVTNCAELFWVRERLKDCSGITPEECPSLVIARVRLEDCASDAGRDLTRDCAPVFPE